MLTFSIIVFIMNVVIFILHTFGSHVLIRITRERNSKPHITLLLWLSCTEATINLLQAITIIPGFIHGGIDTAGTNAFSIVHIISLTGAWLFLYFIMHCIVFDRLVMAMYPLSYNTTVTGRRITRVVLTGAFITSMIIVTTIVADKVTNFNWKHIYFKAVYNTLHVSFIALSVGSYSYIFYKFQSSRKRFKLRNIAVIPKVASGTSTIHMIEANSQPTGTPKVTAFQIFRASKFIISVLLVLTYFLFLIIPDWIYLYWVVIRKSTSHIIEDVCQFLWTFGNLTDFFIYLLGPPKVRKAVKKMFFNQQ